LKQKEMSFPQAPLYGISRFLDSAPLHPKFRRAGFWKAEPYVGFLAGHLFKASGWV
jgi:hypothetical protein